MRGGKIVGITRGCALHKAGAVLLAIQFGGIQAFQLPQAQAHPEEQCARTKAKTEKSIVVSDKKLAEGEGALAMLASADQNGLQPIAKVSEYEPELAEPQTAALEPTLAEPLDAQPIEATLPETTQVASKVKPTTALVTKAPAEVISFHGITPGVSERINVLRTWGDPRSEDTQAAQLKYRFDDLPSVIVHFNGDLVSSIVVELEKPLSPATLSRKLDMQQLRPVSMTDEAGTAVAQAYPERGVILRYIADEQGLAIVSDSDDASADAEPRVSSIEIQPIEASLYLLRAEANKQHHFTNAIADLESALELDRESTEARSTLAALNLEIGKAVTAERYAAEAVELEPQNSSLRLQWAKALRQLARYDRAVEEVRQVLETPGISPLVRAQSLNEMGLLASLGSKTVARRAMPLHSKAIELADSLAVGDDPLVSRAAKQLLVEAHLAVAVEISRGAWQQKDETVPQWIERASGLAEALIAEDSTYLPLRLQVAVSALAAAANLEQPIDPMLWIQEAEETVAGIKAEVFDDLALSRYQWQLGLAYFQGSQIEHRRSKPDQAIHLGELADQQLTQLAKLRDEMPDTSYLMGRLYFQIGAVHAVHFEDHGSACQWYDQAVERLINPVPVTTMAGPQQHGDALVSMGVSYWNENDRETAIEVTELGVELIEQAVASGLLPEETLTVSYSNLSAMYAAQGQKEPAARYQQLAQKITGTKVSQQQQTQPTRSQRR